jgi:hypothetical protein
LNVNAPSDPFGQVILAYAYVQSFGAWAMSADLQYGKPVAYPPILSNFTKPPGAIATDLGITNLTALTISFNDTNPGGFRYASPYRFDVYEQDFDVLTTTLAKHIGH